jgi:hypothetical protein
MAMPDGGNAVIAVDVDSDGYDDLVSANGNTNFTATVSVFRSLRNGTFAVPVSHVTTGARVVVAGDLNNDSAPDLVLAGGGAVGVLLNDGGGTFAEPTYYFDRKLSG